MSHYQLDDADLLDDVADLLYDVNDPRYTDWPNAQRLGRMRHALRSLADEMRGDDGSGLGSRIHEPELLDGDQFEAERARIFGAP